jgi:hypothetical protein
MVLLYGILVAQFDEIKTRTEKDGEKIEIVNTRNYTLWLTPKDVNIRADFSTQKKRRGLGFAHRLNRRLCDNGRSNVPDPQTGLVAPEYEGRKIGIKTLDIFVKSEC